MDKENDSKKIYEQGLDDAWEVLRKLQKMPCTEFYKLFPFCEGMGNAITELIRRMTPAEAIAKIRAYENSQNKIKAGDEVMFCISNGRKNLKGVVIGLENRRTDKIYHIWVLSENSFFVVGDYALRKTGKYYPQVKELLKAMKGE